MGCDSFDRIKMVVVGLGVSEFELGSWILGFEILRLIIYTVQNFVMYFMGKVFNKTNT
jgi:hypothetical protein